MHDQGAVAESGEEAEAEAEADAINSSATVLMPPPPAGDEDHAAAVAAASPPAVDTTAHSNKQARPKSQPAGARHKKRRSTPSERRRASTGRYGQKARNKQQQAQQQQQRAPQQQRLASGVGLANPGRLSRAAAPLKPHAPRLQRDAFRTPGPGAFDVGPALDRSSAQARSSAARFGLHSDGTTPTRKWYKPAPAEKPRKRTPQARNTEFSDLVRRGVETPGPGDYNVDVGAMAWGKEEPAADPHNSNDGDDHRHDNDATTTTNNNNNNNTNNNNVDPAAQQTSGSSKRRPSSTPGARHRRRRSQSGGGGQQRSTTFGVAERHTIGAQYVEGMMREVTPTVATSPFVLAQRRPGPGYHDPDAIGAKMPRSPAHSFPRSQRQTGFGSPQPTRTPARASGSSSTTTATMAVGTTIGSTTGGRRRKARRDTMGSTLPFADPAAFERPSVTKPRRRLRDEDYRGTPGPGDYNQGAARDTTLKRVTHRYTFSQATRFDRDKTRRRRRPKHWAQSIAAYEQRLNDAAAQQGANDEASSSSSNGGGKHGRSKRRATTSSNRARSNSNNNNKNKNNNRASRVLSNHRTSPAYTMGARRSNADLGNVNAKSGMATFQLKSQAVPTPGPTDYFNDVEKELAVRTGSRGHKKAPAYTFAKQHLVGSLAAGANGNASTPGPGSYDDFPLTSLGGTPNSSRLSRAPSMAVMGPASRERDTGAALIHRTGSKRDLPVPGPGAYNTSRHQVGTETPAYKFNASPRGQRKTYTPKALAEGKGDINEGAPSSDQPGPADYHPIATNHGQAAPSSPSITFAGAKTAASRIPLGILVSPVASKTYKRKGGRKSRKPSTAATTPSSATGGKRRPRAKSAAARRAPAGRKSGHPGFVKVSSRPRLVDPCMDVHRINPAVGPGAYSGNDQRLAGHRTSAKFSMSKATRETRARVVAPDAPTPAPSAAHGAVESPGPGAYVGADAGLLGAHTASSTIRSSPMPVIPRTPSTQQILAPDVMPVSTMKTPAPGDFETVDVAIGVAPLTSKHIRSPGMQFGTSPRRFLGDV